MKKIYLSFILLLFAVVLVSCSSDKIVTPDIKPYDTASISKGGIMYDKFWSTEAGFNQSDPNLAVFNAKSEFFRCKSCHAWDLFGNSGSYIGRGPTATRPRVDGLNLYQYIQGSTPQQLFDAIKTGSGAARRDISYDLNLYNPTSNPTEGDQMPNYSQFLSDTQIWNIVKFLKEGAFNVSELYDAVYTGTYPTGTAAYSNIGKNGNAANGMTFYNSNCQSCHGADGTTILMDGLTVGKFTRTKGYEVQHKVKYGQLGTGMVGEFDMSLTQMRDLYKAISDPSVFPD